MYINLSLSYPGVKAKEEIQISYDSQCNKSKHMCMRKTLAYPPRSYEDHHS